MENSTKQVPASWARRMEKNRKAFAAGYQVLADMVVRFNHWLLVQDLDGNRFIGLVVMETASDKVMTEHEGPAQIDCPLELLEQACETSSPTALDWRAKVRAGHAEEQDLHRKMGALEKGDSIVQNGVRYIFSKTPGQNEWVLLSMSSDKVFYITEDQIRQAFREGRITTLADQAAQAAAADAAKRDARARAQAVAKGFDEMSRDRVADQGALSLGLGGSDLVFEE